MAVSEGCNAVRTAACLVFGGIVSFFGNFFVPLIFGRELSGANMFGLVVLLAVLGTVGFARDRVEADGRYIHFDAGRFPRAVYLLAGLAVSIACATRNPIDGFTYGVLFILATSRVILFQSIW
jgi:hypothetical protein